MNVYAVYCYIVDVYIARSPSFYSFDILWEPIANPYFTYFISVTSMLLFYFCSIGLFKIINPHNEKESSSLFDKMLFLIIILIQFATFASIMKKLIYG